MVNYFFDSYAIIELLDKNPAYKKYEEFPLVTAVMNKIEVASWGLVTYGEKFSDIVVNSLRHVVDISDEVIKEAVRMKRRENKRNISYTDCIGYCFARQNGLLFLTGDKEFKDLPGVEFVK
jgi:predicted nucleic acid-binding protein